MPGPCACRGSSNSVTCLLIHRVWYWGHCAVYDSGGYIQELGLSLQESLTRLHFLQLHNWIDNRWATLLPLAPTGSPCHVP